MKFIAGSPKGETVAKFIYEADFDGLRDEAKAHNFSGKERELMVAHPAKGPKRLIVAGLGKKDRFTTEKLRRAAAQIGQRARTLDLTEISIVPPPGDREEHSQAVVEGVALALYEYKRYKSKPQKPLKLQTVRVDGDADAVRRGEIYARATCVTRDLVNDPPSVCTPRYLADAAKKIAKNGIGIKVFDEKMIKKMGMGGLEGVSAYKTRDILRAMNGKTMEIINTDAEGRLILADALSYASRLKPSEIIDMATLTGACVVALGPDMSAIFTASDKLQKGILAAARAEGEKIWPMPLENEYMEMIKSDVADMKNSGGRWGGAITAALFLREFVDDGIPWAHLDIAGPALVENDRPYRPAGGTGVMVRTLLRYLEEQ